MLRLEIRQRHGEPTVFETAKTPLFVGRDPSMDLVLDDPSVSRQHAVLITRGDDLVIQDVGGRNPLRVNQKVVVTQVLRPGDIISLGQTELIYTESVAPPEASPPSAAQPTVVNVRESLAHFRETSSLLSPEDTIKGHVHAGPGVEDSSRSPPNLRILRNFSEVIRNLSERQKLLEAAFHTVLDHLDVKRGLIGFFNPEGQMEVAVERRGGRSRGLPSRPMLERIRREAVAVLFTGEDADTAVSATAAAKNAKGAKGAKGAKNAKGGAKSAMCLPLFRADEVCGVLYLDSSDRGQEFSQEDLYFANILSNLISLAVEKEELYERISYENIELKTILHQKNRLVGVSSAIKDVQRKIKRVASFDTTVLITGQSGTGKELVARAIHDRSPRRAKPFIAVNCAAIPETLLEAELFGYAPRSGISGADPRGKPGKFELAHGGTLFLDEIGDMSLSTQSKILRVLEDRVVDRLGGMKGQRVDLRILAATNKVLSKAVAKGLFREDLFYRLKVFQIQLTPLRDRREDILPLAQHFLTMHEQEGRGPLDLSPRAKELLLAYHWPGNCRELKHCIEEAILLSNGRTIYPENLPAELRRDDNPQPFGTLAEVEAQHIQRVLQSVNWNKRRAAEMLGINRSTLYEKIRLYQIERPQEVPRGTLPRGSAVNRAAGDSSWS